MGPPAGGIFRVIWHRVVLETQFSIYLPSVLPSLAGPCSLFLRGGRKVEVWAPFCLTKHVTGNEWFRKLQGSQHSGPKTDLGYM